MALALEGIKVLDLSQWAAVPMAARFLGDLGASVIHVEHPVRGDATRTLQSMIAPYGSAQSNINYLWENYNRNKRGMTIDLSKHLGQEILYRLVEKADVFLTNMRPYELERYKLEYNTLNQLNSNLIYGALTGYGEKGSEINSPAFDTISYWSRGGIPHGLSQPGMPSPVFVGAFGDNVAGMALACGVITALFVRERTGKGQSVHIALFQLGVFQMSFDIAGVLISKQDCEDWRRKPPEEVVAKAKAAIEPLWNFSRRAIANALAMPYKTKGEREIRLAMWQSDFYWCKFCQAIKQVDLEHDPMFESFEARERNVDALMHILDDIFIGKTLDEWKSTLVEKGIPFGYDQNYLEVIADPQARANDFFVPIEHPTYGHMEVIANPINLSGTPTTVSMPAPEFGQHTEEVLLEHGYTWDDISQFKEQGVIA